jgi:RHS repeat-associated protein
MKNCKQILKAITLFACGLTALLSTPLTQAQEVRTYFITHGVGSPVIATDAYANITWSEDYLPYGERRYRSTASGANERWFTNAPQNEDTGLIDLGNRQYDPVIGRFLNIDPVATSPSQPFSINRYAYANNNPYRFVDPNGGNPVAVLFAMNAGTGAVIGGGSAAATNALLQYHETGAIQWSGIGGVWDAAGDGAVVGAVLGAFGAGEAGSVAGATSASLRSGAESNSVKVTPHLRQGYVDAVSDLRAAGDSLRVAGAGSEQIARALHAERRAIGEQFKALTPSDKLTEIYQQNMTKYGDKLGPSVDWLRSQGKSWDQIIDSAGRTGGKDIGF